MRKPPNRKSEGVRSEGCRVWEPLGKPMPARQPGSNPYPGRGRGGLEGGRPPGTLGRRGQGKDESALRRLLSSPRSAQNGSSPPGSKHGRDSLPDRARASKKLVRDRPCQSGLVPARQRWRGGRAAEDAPAGSASALPVAELPPPTPSSPTPETPVGSAPWGSRPRRCPRSERPHTGIPQLTTKASLAHAQ
eukprot:12072353-Alexandrium_andersonii.AAC.1